VRANSTGNLPGRRGWNTCARRVTPSRIFTATLRSTATSQCSVALFSRGVQAIEPRKAQLNIRRAITLVSRATKVTFFSLLAP
jgi:hypothetical protein